MDCPFCGGRYTFGVTQQNGILRWGCFRASCQAKGVLASDRSLDGIKHWLTEQQDKSSKISLPTPLVSINRHTSIIQWLEERHCLQAYESKLVDIRYCPTEDRIMFMMPGNSGCIGRSLDGSWPKWKKYGDTSHVFTCGTGQTGVIVEDAASACAVGVIPTYTGVSLLGTKLTLTHKSDLRRFNTVLVCLDPDAAARGLEIVRRLNGVADAKLRIIRDDLKYFSTDKIVQMLESM